MNWKIKTVAILLFVFLQGCGIYSFTGASISADTKTFSIVQFQNNAPIVVPYLSQVLSEKMRDKFVTQTTLKTSSNDPHLVFEGRIEDYVVLPVAITGNEVASSNRLTIRVRVIFTNNLDPKQNWESVFSRFVDFPSTEALSAVENGLIDEIVNQLVDDVFNKAFVNW